MRERKLHHAREHMSFDPLAEGRRYGLSRELALAIWKRACDDSTDGQGQLDDMRARRRFHNAATRIAARGGRLLPDVGKETRVNLELQSDPRAAHTRRLDELTSRVPGRTTLVAAEAVRWQFSESPTPATAADAGTPATRPELTGREDVSHALAALQSHTGALEAIWRANRPLRDVVAPAHARLAAATASPPSGRRPAPVTVHGAHGDPAKLRMSHRSHRGDAAELEAEAVARSAVDAVDAERGRSVSEPWPRSALSSALGTDLEGVEIRADHRVDRVAHTLGARAFTVAGQAHIRSADFNPGDRGGLLLLAHELVHVIQQGGAPRLGPPATNLLHTPSDQVHGDWLDNLRRSAFEYLIAGLRGAQRAGLRRLEAWAARQGSDRALAQAVVDGVRGVSEALISLALAVSGVVVGFAAGIIDMLRGLIALLIGVMQGILLALYSLIDGGERLSAWARPIAEGLRQLPHAIRALVDAWLVEFQAADTDRQTFMIGELTGQILALLATFGATARGAGAVSRLSAAITVPARELVTAREIVLVPARTITVSVDVASPVAAAGFSGAVMMRVPTPSGTVTPQRGPHAGRSVS